MKMSNQPSTSSGRAPIILAKAPARDKEKDPGANNASQSSSSSGATTSHSLAHPTFILKSREGESRAISPGTVQTQRKDSDSHAYQLASKPPDGTPLEMKACVKLVDDSMQLCDNLCEFLLDQMDYLVVGCVGMQGVGKSTLMSYLAGAKAADPVKSFVFKPETSEQQELACHATNGIDAFITPDRCLLLDSQPLLSASFLDSVIQQEKKYSLEFAPTETGVELHSLQMTAFLLSVCHVVLVVQDWPCDPTLLRFMQTAEMLKPATATTSQDLEEVVEYFPHLVMVHNRAAPPDFELSQLVQMQELLSRTFAKSRFLLRSGVCTMPDADSLNLFLVPEHAPGESSDGVEGYHGHDEIQVVLDQFRMKAFGVAHNPLTYAMLTEKNWFHYASRTWDAIKKSNFFHEYNRLLQ